LHSGGGKVSAVQGEGEDLSVGGQRAEEKEEVMSRGKE